MAGNRLVYDSIIEAEEIYLSTVLLGELFAGFQGSKKRNKIPLNDVWIAAHTIETGSKLITFDSHFKQITGLRIWEELK